MKGAKQEEVIKVLNPKLRGFAEYYKGVCSKVTFSYIDYRVWEYLIVNTLKGGRAFGGGLSSGETPDVYTPRLPLNLHIVTGSPQHEEEKDGNQLANC